MKRAIRKTGLCLAACAYTIMAAGLWTDSWGYESSTVTNGATLQGKITFSGTVPDPKIFELRRYYDREYCKALSDGKGHRLLKEVNIGSDGGLRDVVVVVEGIEKGKPFTVTDAEVEASL